MLRTQSGTRTAGTDPSTQDCAETQQFIQAEHRQDKALEIIPDSEDVRLPYKHLKVSIHNSYHTVKLSKRSNTFCFD